MEDVYQSIDAMVDFPFNCQKLTPDIWRKLLKRYPFGVIYRIDGNDIVIIAIMNLKRKPFYWMSRV